MSCFRSCVAIINTRSGAQESRSVFASALQQYLDRAGIIHHDILIPERNARHALEHHALDSDAIVVCGGDGTLSSVLNVMATTSCAVLPTRPVVVVPCGLQNSMAHSLGIHSAERAVSAFVMGRVERLPLWAVRVNRRVVRYMASYVAVGAYAACVRRLHLLDRVGERFLALPTPRRRFTLAALYTSLRAEPAGGAGALRAGGALCALDAPLRLLLAAQMPLQHRRYSLTPSATHKHGHLCVTYATAEATRARMWHLLSREATSGAILSEDGVRACREVEEVRLRWAEEDGPMELAVDGETVDVPIGAEVEVCRTPHTALLVAC